MTRNFTENSQRGTNISGKGVKLLERTGSPPFEGRERKRRSVSVSRNLLELTSWKLTLDVRFGKFQRFSARVYASCCCCCHGLIRKFAVLRSLCVAVRSENLQFFPPAVISFHGERERERERERGKKEIREMENNKAVRYYRRADANLAAQLPRS